MREAGYTYAVSTELEFTREETDYLIELALSHYDGKCKAAGSSGGFLFGLRNKHLFEAKEHDSGHLESWSFDIHELSTLVKILEMEIWAPLARRLDLFWQLTQILRKTISETRRVNNIPESSISEPYLSY